MSTIIIIDLSDEDELPGLVPLIERESESLSSTENVEEFYSCKVCSRVIPKGRSGRLHRELCLANKDDHNDVLSPGIMKKQPPKRKAAPDPGTLSERPTKKRRIEPRAFLATEVDRLYPVDRILGHRKDSSGNYEFFVHWIVSGSDDGVAPTWEPFSSFVDTDDLGYWETINEKLAEYISDRPEIMGPID